MKVRHVLWPAVVFGALGLVGACSSDGGSGSAGAAGGESAGGDDGAGDAGKGSGATSSMGGMTGSDAGMPGVAGGDNQSGGAGGAAADLCEGLELECEDDDNPCTEDECNPATGECGIPRSETLCDDGLYCNGEDICVEGECTAGTEDPCGGRTCNEAMNSCECVTDDHCPADVPGEWGACEYVNAECSEIGERSRLVTTFTCTEGLCVQGATTEDEACGARETDTSPCTSDNLRCNGAEACKNGACTPAGTNQCPNQPATPYCAESGNLCNECTSSTHCAGTEKCCTVSGTRQCIPKNGSNVCFQISDIQPAVTSFADFAP